MIASLLKPKSPQPIIIAPIMAIPMVINADKVVRSLNRRKPPSNETIGCKARMMVELATVVNFKDPNQRTKCRARKKPEKNKKNQSFFMILLNSLRFFQTMGTIKILANHIRYILKIEAGASDHLTKIAENEMAMIEMVSGSPIDRDPTSCCFIISPYAL